MTTETTSTTLDASDPLSHPDFVACNDPRLEAKWDKPVVYVPNLVYLIHKLGGPDNISEDHEFPSVITEYGTTIVEVVRWPGKDAGEPFGLFVEGWHHESCLTVLFDVPAKWHLGDWTVNTVMDADIFSASAELDREVALLCNRMVGERLADRFITS
jgi:hypothetical protein